MVDGEIGRDGTPPTDVPPGDEGVGMEGDGEMGGGGVGNDDCGVACELGATIGAGAMAEPDCGPENDGAIDPAGAGADGTLVAPGLLTPPRPVVDRCVLGTPFESIPIVPVWPGSPDEVPGAADGDPNPGDGTDDGFPTTELGGVAPNGD